MVDQVPLSLMSRGTLDKTAASLGGKVNAEHYDTAKNFLASLDENATVRIVNGRSKDRELVLSTKSNSGNFYSRKPVTKEFFKQACIGRFGDVPAGETARAFEEEYGKVRNGAGMHSAGHFLAVMEALEKKFAAGQASRSEHQKSSSDPAASGGPDADEGLKAFREAFDNFLLDNALRVPADRPSEGRLSTFSDRFGDDASFLEEMRRTRKSLPGSLKSEGFRLTDAAKQEVREEKNDRYSIGSEERFKSFADKSFGPEEERGTVRESDARLSKFYDEALRNPRAFGSEAGDSEDGRRSDASDKSV